MTDTGGGGQQVEPANTTMEAETVTPVLEITKAGNSQADHAKDSAWRKETSRSPNFQSGYSQKFPVCYFGQSASSGREWQPCPPPPPSQSSQQPSPAGANPAGLRQASCCHIQSVVWALGRVL